MPGLQDSKDHTPIIPTVELLHVGAVPATNTGVLDKTMMTRNQVRVCYRANREFVVITKPKVGSATEHAIANSYTCKRLQGVSLTG